MIGDGNLLRASGFEGTTSIIDVNCRKSDVLKIEKQRRSWDLLYFLGGPHKMYVVDYEIGPPTHLSFDQAKNILIELILRKRWYAQGGESRDEFTERFRSYESMKEIMDSISAYGDVWY